MADIVNEIKAKLEGPIDFESQRSTYKVSTYMLAAGAIVASLTGFVAQRLDVSLAVFVTSIVLTMLTVVPPWPQYNKNKIQWLEPQVPKFE